MIITITRIEVADVIKPGQVDLTGAKAAAFVGEIGLKVSFDVDSVYVYRDGRISMFGQGCHAVINVGEAGGVMIDIAHKIATDK